MRRGSLANLGFAAGSGVIGIGAAPFDGARRARAAGSGLWYSLPELAFFNIRKGTFEWVPSAASGARSEPTTSEATSPDAQE